MNTLSLIAIASTLISVSAVCSGLNLSLMSLDLEDLKRKAKLGDKRAQRVLPVPGRIARGDLALASGRAPSLVGRHHGGMYL